MSTKTKINLATWNIQTLARTNQVPDKEFWLVEALEQSEIHMAALQETRRAAGSLEVKEWLLLLGDAETGNHAGTGFAVSPFLKEYVVDFKSISTRLSLLELQIEERKLAILSCYAPTLASHDEAELYNFYSEIEQFLREVPLTTEVVLLGDLNAVLGQDIVRRKGVIGPWTDYESTEGGYVLAEFVLRNKLKVVNTLYKHKRSLRWTFRRPNTKRRVTLDYCLMRERSKTRIVDSKVADLVCWSDHRPLVTTIVWESKTPLSRRKVRNRSQKMPKRWNVEGLKRDSKVKERYENTALELWRSSEYESPLEVLSEAASRTLNLQRKVTKPWFEHYYDDAYECIRIKKSAWKLFLRGLMSQAEWASHRNRCTRMLRELKHKWVMEKGAQIDENLRTNPRIAFDLMRELRMTFRGAPLLRNKNGSLASSTEQMLDIWKLHFSDLLNHPSHARLFEENMEKCHELDVDPTLEETLEAIDLLANNTAPGEDLISPEMVKALPSELKNELHKLMCRYWNSPSEIPQEWKNSILVPIFKKGDRTNTNNYRGISLLAVTGKVLAALVAKRLKTFSENTIGEGQFGFRPNRGTTHAVFTMRQLIEKSHELSKPIYVVFIDFVKAFDKVNRETLFNGLVARGLPPKLSELVRTFHQGTQAQVRVNNMLSDMFAIVSGVRQGCKMAPFLFNLYADLIFEEALKGIKGVEFVEAQSPFPVNENGCKTQWALPALLYADDAVLCSTNPCELQKALTQVESVAKSYNMELSIEKTVVMTTADDMPTITVYGHPLKRVEEFNYLGSVISADSTLSKEIANRVKRAQVAWLRSLPLWSLQTLTVKSKCQLFRSLVLSGLAYGGSAWVLTYPDQKKIETFVTRKLRILLKIRPDQHVPNYIVYQRAGLLDFRNSIQRQRLHFFSELVDRNEGFIPRRMVFSTLAGGSRQSGGQRKRWKDQLLQDLTELEVKHETWECIVRDRRAWLTAITKDISDAPRRRYLRRRERMTRTRRENQCGDFPCTQCNKLFGKEDRLTRHEKRVHPSRIALPFQCSHCDKSYAVEKSLKNHTAKLHSTVATTRSPTSRDNRGRLISGRSGKGKCEKCGLISTKSGLSRHKCGGLTTGSAPRLVTMKEITRPNPRGLSNSLGCDNLATPAVG